MLSVVVGFYVIGKVHHALHTPLMSVTNAISGIIIVGAMLQLASPVLVVQVLAAIAVLLASINVFGGFAVTRRMLAMFHEAAAGDRGGALRRVHRGADGRGIRRRRRVHRRGAAVHPRASRA